MTGADRARRPCWLITFESRAVKWSIEAGLASRTDMVLLLPVVTIDQTTRYQITGEETWSLDDFDDPLLYFPSSSEN